MRKKREVHFLYTSPIRYSVASAVALAAAGVVSVLSAASETLLLPSFEALVSDFVFALLFDVLLLEVLLLEDALLVFFFGVVATFFVDDEDVDVVDLCVAVEELLVVCFFGVVCATFLLVVVEDEVDEDDVLGRRRYVDEVEDEVDALDVLEDAADDDVDVEDVAGVETLVSVSSCVVSGVSFTTLAATILNVYSNSPVYFLIPFAIALALPTFLFA